MIGKKIRKNKMAPLVFIVVIISSVYAGCLTDQSKDSGVIYQAWMRAGDMQQQIATRNIDGFIAWEPIVSETAISGKGTVLAYSDTIWPHHPCCVLVISRAGLEKLDRNAVLGMVWAHIKMTQFINNPQNYNETVESIATSTGVDDNTARESLKHITYTYMPSVQAAHDIYDALESAGYLKTNVTTLGYANVDQFLNHFVQLEFVNETKQRLSENPNWAPAPSNTTTIKLGVLSGDSHKLAAVMALNKSYYASVGLQIEIKQYSSGITLVEGFKSGEIDMGYCGIAPALLRAINDNVQITVIAAANDEGSGLIVNTDAGVHTLSDLEGKTIATPSAGSLQDVLLRKIAAQQHLRIEIK